MEVEKEKEKDVSEMYVRFQKDLEFVQMLANPYYISCLSKHVPPPSLIFSRFGSKKLFPRPSFLELPQIS